MNATERAAWTSLLFCTNYKTTRLVYDMKKRDELIVLESWEGPVNELMDALALKQREDQANYSEKYRFQSNTINVIELSLV